MLEKTLNIINLNGDSFKLNLTIEAVHENIKKGDMGSAIGQCKNLVESLSKNILKNKSIAIEDGVSFPKLVKNAVKALDIGKIGNDDSRTREAFFKITSSISSSIETVANSMATLRNTYGKNEHGHDNNFIDIPKEYAYLVIYQTDVITSFLLDISRRHDEFQPEINLKDNEDFNDYLYDTFGQIEIFGDLYQAPDILFNLHPKKYKEALDEYRVGITNDVE